MMTWLVRVAAFVVLMMALSGLPWSGRAEEARWGERPPQFYQPLGAELSLAHGSVLGVAHNAGDDAPASELALAHGADVIEIDVIAYEGRLHAAHTPPPIWLPAIAYRGPTLDEAWNRAAGARYVSLDLKDASPSTLRMVVRFLTDHADGRRVYVTARDLDALVTLQEQAPDAVRMLSIGDRAGLQELQNDPGRAALLNGVSVQASLLDGETIAWFKERGLLVEAWTINDVALCNDLLAGGVDAIATDNLALLDALRRAEQLRRSGGSGDVSQLHEETPLGMSGSDWVKGSAWNRQDRQRGGQWRTPMFANCPDGGCRPVAGDQSSPSRTLPRSGRSHRHRPGWA
jgi:hypothetical protein